MKKYSLKMKQPTLSSCYLAVLMLTLLSCGLMAHADENTTSVSLAPATETVVDSPLLREQEVQQELALMKTHLDSRIEAWGNTLTPDDFEWTLRGRMLKQPKRIEVCNIFQKVINETYQLIYKNKANLDTENQKILENRSGFIQQLGIKNNTIPTKLGFDCIVK